MRSGRRKNTSEKISDGGTMTMFTSLMLILLTFFIMLSRNANFDDAKLGRVIGSIESAFGILPGGRSLDGLPGLSPYDGREEINRELEPVKRLLAPLISDEQARFSFQGLTYTVSLSADYLFEAEAPAELRAEGRQLLLALSEAVRDVSAPLVIEAHTDDQPPAAQGFGDNWRLSAYQAGAVVRFMILEGRLNPRLLSAYGYAGYRPVAVNNNPFNRFQNRRVNLILDFSRSEMARRILGRRRWIDIEGLPFSTDDPGRRDNQP